MARVNVVKSARKDQGTCEKCGDPLPVGSSYKWIEPRAFPGAASYKRKRCMKCPSWRPSETTSSTALAAIYGAQESASDDIASWDGDNIEDLRGILQACAEGIREGAEAWRESAQNIEDGFGHATFQSDELNEKADTVESSADDVEQTDLEEWDEDEAINDIKLELGITDEATDEQAAKVADELEVRKADWADAQRDRAQEAVDGVDIP